MFPPKNPKAFSVVPFEVDLEQNDIQELLKFRDTQNGDLNATTMEIKIGWKNHYAWRSSFLKTTKRLFSTRKTYISDPENFASLLQIGLNFPSVKKVIDHVVNLSASKPQYDERAHHDAGVKYIEELEQLINVAEKKSLNQRDNRQFIEGIITIVNTIKNNLFSVYPERPPLDSEEIIIE